MVAVGSYTENRGLMQGSAQSAGAGDGDEEPNKKYWFLNIKRYRRFFNVDTEVSCCPGTLALALECYELAKVVGTCDTKQKQACDPQGHELHNVNIAQCMQDILIRIRDSVIGSYKADFFDKTTDNADL